MNDIRPPRRPLPPRPAELPRPVAPPAPVSEPQQLVEPFIAPVDMPVIAEPPQPPKKSYKKLILGLIFGVLGFMLLVCAAAVSWYYLSLGPVGGSDKDRVRISIASGTAPSEIAKELHAKGLIKSVLAFDIYTRMSGTRNKLQAGAYSLSPSESTQGIVEHLTSGKTDQMTITFYPGATLRDHTDTPSAKKTDAETMLLRAGYEQTEIDTAFNKVYDHPLFVDKPAGTDLEGYIYGETYTFSSDATVEQILTHTFDVYYAKIQENNLVSLIQQQELNLYQGIILASIIQREVPNATDQKQVAQIFLKRYREGMVLGSDITAYYGADKLGEPRTVAVESPYNTRINAGLPPGPIATPGLSALEAVAAPADGDYVYFLSGDDDVTYYARTNEEHEANIRDHCQVKCAIP